jgi:hypothetical protein
VGDVGWNLQEEVSFLPAGSPPGANFGWDTYEGSSLAPAPACPLHQPFTHTAPSITYDHSAGGARAVTGGVVVRDASVAPLLGRYLYADYYAGEIRSAVVGPGTASGDGASGLQVDNLGAFGEDSRCRVHVVGASSVYRLEAVAPAAAPACQTASAPPAPPPPPPPPDRSAPSLTRVSLSRARFRVSVSPTPRIAVLRRRLAPLGTVFRWTLNERSEVSFRVYRAKRGRRSGRRCVIPTRRLRRARRCTRYPLFGTLVRRAVAPGRRSLRFTGRVGLRALPPGRYRVTVRARDAAGNVSAGRLLRFTVVRR